jgi:hypothetical protein
MVGASLEIQKGARHILTLDCCRFHFEGIPRRRFVVDAKRNWIATIVYI